MQPRPCTVWDTSDRELVLWIDRPSAFFGLTILMIMFLPIIAILLTGVGVVAMLVFWAAIFFSDHFLVFRRNCLEWHMGFFNPMVRVSHFPRNPKAGLVVRRTFLSDGNPGFNLVWSGGSAQWLIEENADPDVIKNLIELIISSTGSELTHENFDEPVFGHVLAPKGPLTCSASAVQEFGERVRKLREELPRLRFGPIFQPESDGDQKLTLQTDPVIPVEVDSLGSLKISQEKRFAPFNEFVVFQHRDEGTPIGAESFPRCGRGLSIDEAREIGMALKGGPTRHLFLGFSAVKEGAIRTLSNALGEGQLMGMGFLWIAPGEKIPEMESHLSEIAYAATMLGLGSVTILTTDFDDGCEERLLEGLNLCPSIRRVKVFRIDEVGNRLEIPTPKLQGLLDRNPRSNQ